MLLYINVGCMLMLLESLQLPEADSGDGEGGVRPPPPFFFFYNHFEELQTV